jgi:phosphoenolpyruvate carboxykinase (ATP)
MLEVDGLLERRLADFGLSSPRALHENLSVPALVAQAIRRGEGELSSDGALVVLTGARTGRSPNDKFIVEDGEATGDVDFGPLNQPFERAHFTALLSRVVDHLNQRELFVQDASVGADPQYRLGLRLVTSSAWHALFAKNLFRVGASTSPLSDGEPFLILHAREFSASPARDRTHSEAFVILDLTKRIILIGGTRYAGEIKKSVFSVMNVLLPRLGVLPMHAAVNADEAGVGCVFFGLSGTGKTTLSADESRFLVGDDEHGLAPSGLFNFEGGCYAKTIRLSAAAEPGIWQAVHSFGTVLENVVLEPGSGRVDFDSARYTENTRAAYPLSRIENAVPDGRAGDANSVILLTADAYGVLPAVAKLSPEQAMYHFLSGYTAKVAGTEGGVKTPTATFSACFGAPFLPLHPTVYGELFRSEIAARRCPVWLVNTGWFGGVTAGGARIPIDTTRVIVRAIQSGHLEGTARRVDPLFGFEVPRALSGVDPKYFDPQTGWSDVQAFAAASGHLAQAFHENFERFAPGVSPEVCAQKPRLDTWARAAG